MTTKMLERRRAVAEMLAEGVSVREIAERLDTSARTIYSDREAINADPDTYGDAENPPSEPIKDGDSVVDADPANYDDGVIIVESSPQGVVAQFVEVIDDGETYVEDESSIEVDVCEDEQVDEPEDDDELNPNEMLILDLEGYTNKRGIRAIAVIQKGLQMGLGEGLDYEVEDASILMTRENWEALAEGFEIIADEMPERIAKDDDTEYPGTKNQIVDMLGGLSRFIECKRSILKVA